MAAILENGRFWRPCWFFKILDIRFGVRMVNHILIDTKIVKIDYLHDSLLFYLEKWRPFWKMAAIVAMAKCWDASIPKKFRFGIP